MNVLDEKDELIIKVLSRDSGMSIRSLSSRLILPISTIHRRIKKLEENGIINGYRAIIDYEKTSWPIGALLLIDLFEVVPGKGHIPKKVILDHLKKLDEVEEIVDVQAADFDLVVRTRFSSLSRLSDFMEELRSVEGIEETRSAIITKEILIQSKSIIR